MSITSIAFATAAHHRRPCRIIISSVTPRVEGSPWITMPTTVAHQQRCRNARSTSRATGRGIGGQHDQRRAALAGADIGRAARAGRGGWRSSGGLRQVGRSLPAIWAQPPARLATRLRRSAALAAPRRHGVDAGQPPGACLPPDRRRAMTPRPARHPRRHRARHQPPRPGQGDRAAIPSTPPGTWKSATASTAASGNPPPARGGSAMRNGNMSASSRAIRS